MRRVLAALLLAFFGIGPLSPLLTANPSLELPACCRRDGKHHCAMTEMGLPPDRAGGTPQSGALAFTSRCPFFPQSLFTPHSPTAAALTAPQSAAVSAFAAPVLLRANSLALRQIQSNAAHKRGPPSVL